MADQELADLAEGDGEDDGALCLYDAFPHIEEDMLQCLCPWPSGAESIGVFYDDLFSPPEIDLSEPPDPILRVTAELRSRLAHIQVIRISGAGQQESGFARDVIVQSVVKFSSLYAGFCSSLIKRFWKAHRRAATEDDRKRFAEALATGPAHGTSDQEREVRKGYIDEIIHSAPFAF
jgi:hypothetical protein